MTTVSPSIYASPMVIHVACNIGIVGFTGTCKAGAQNVRAARPLKGLTAVQLTCEHLTDPLGIEAAGSLRRSAASHLANERRIQRRTKNEPEFR